MGTVGAVDFAERLRDSVVAAVLTPRDAEGRLARTALEAYAADICSRVDGVCVTAHTGRGARLSVGDRATVIRTFRQVCAAPVVAGVAVPPDPGSHGFEEQLDTMAQLAEDSVDAGADAVMVMPCPALVDPEHRHKRALQLHEEIGRRAGVPVIAFLLYDEAGGCGYDVDLLTELSSLPAVAGVKIATLDDAVRCQDAIAAVRAAGALAITGEDRMLGPSFMWGAEAALVGIAAAVPELSVQVARSWVAGAPSAFVSASQRVDRFAAATFCSPMDGYVQRMLWAAEWEGAIPHDAVVDPWAPALSHGERDRLIATLEAMRAESAPVPS